MSDSRLIVGDLRNLVDNFLVGDVRPSETNGLRSDLLNVVRLHLDASRAESREHFHQTDDALDGSESDPLLIERGRLDELMLAKSVLVQLGKAE